MASFLLRVQVVLSLAALTVPMVGSGACASRTACLVYSQAEFDANQGSCLSPAKALASFTSPSCPGSIASVDGVGTYDGEICCYPVTYDSLDQSCNTGTGGDITTFPTDEPPPPEPFPDCAFSCIEAVFDGRIPCSDPGSEFYSNLQACACKVDSSEPMLSCAGACGFSLCSVTPVDSDCISCLETLCPDDWSNCQAN